MYVGSCCACSAALLECYGMASSGSRESYYASGQFVVQKRFSGSRAGLCDRVSKHMFTIADSVLRRRRQLERSSRRPKVDSCECCNRFHDDLTFFNSGCSAKSMPSVSSRGRLPDGDGDTGLFASEALRASCCSYVSSSKSMPSSSPKSI